MIIDLHTHAFPEKIAARTLEALIANTARISDYPMKNYTDGTASGLLEVERRAGVDLAVVLPIVTNPKQSETINRVAKETNDANCGLYSFGSLHPADPDALSWVDRLAEDGLKGIKLHPEFQNIYADSDEMTAVCRRAAQYGMTVVLHAGRDIGYLPPVKTEPDMLLRLIDRVPDLKLVAAHLGGCSGFAPHATDEIIDLGCWADTSALARNWSRDEEMRLCRSWPTERLLYGTDFPWVSYEESLRWVKSMRDEKDWFRVLGENARELLGL